MRGALPLLVALAACGPGGPTPLEVKVPRHFPALEVPASNPTTVEGVALGRRLYYEPLLSNDGRACASCHLQRVGFTLPGTAVLPHVNLGWNRNFLWNGEKAGTLEDVMRFEVEEFFAADVSKLEAAPGYPAQFRAAFGGARITSGDAARALAQFTRTLVSGDAPFDRFLLGTGALTPDQQRGFTLFFSEKGDCFHCHPAPLTTDRGFHNNGLEAQPAGVHAGRFAVTGAAADLGLFKTPSLRNIALRGAFMHDGRFTSLLQVVEHYDSGVARAPTVDPLLLRPAGAPGLGLTAAEKADLVAFLEALTDDTFLTSPGFGAPP